LFFALFTYDADLLLRAIEHVKLADKLSNLNDLISDEGRPAGWSVERIQVGFSFLCVQSIEADLESSRKEYFVWSKQVTDQCISVNAGLGSELDELYRNAKFSKDGKDYKCHPTYQA